MLMPPRIHGALPRRPISAHPEPHEWRAFVGGACGLMAILAVCLFIVARLGA